MRCEEQCVFLRVLCVAVLLQPLTPAFICEDSIDCRALLKFKEGITSDPNGHIQDWDRANSICNWTGITCHPHLENRVMALELIGTGLQGSISPFLSNLSLLTTLSLYGNSIHGSIPSSIGLLSELSYLNLSTNKLQSSIPNSLQGCWSLKIVDLTVNNLSGSIPEGIGRMKNLTFLALSVNNLTGAIPSFLSNLTELTQLELAANYFTGNIPTELESLTKVEIMYLHLNLLEGNIPASLSNCTALREISLIENLLTGKIPTELGKLQNIQKIYFINNKLSGQIPASLSNLSQLTLLDLSMNYLEGEVPPELGKLKNLEILYLHSNNLVSSSTFSFLTALGNCSLLQKLHLGSCYFSGSLPSSIGYLSRDLYYFNLLDNRITGAIPDGIGNLSSLVNLNLNYNSLGGTLPTMFGKLGQLQRLYLGKNKLIGVIPKEIGQMANLGLLDLSDNIINGPIPSSLGTLSQLRYLYLSHNRLSGSIPVELTHCSLLMLLDLSFNNLQGSLPTEIGGLSDIGLSLNLSNNNFEREIPASIGNLVSVKAIDLSKNKFSGDIPNTLGACISLEYLNLSNNMLEGPIPQTFKLIRSLGILDLALNHLSGSFPIWLASDMMIKYLNVSYNKLTGEVPELWRFTKNISTSFVGNEGLCGGSAIMDLPSCDIGKENSKRWILYVVVSAVSGALLIFLSLVFIVCCRLRKNKASEPLDSVGVTSPSHQGRRTYTQRELEISTEGFSEANLLGKGSFGSVYKATMDDGKTVLAVKVLHEESSQGYSSLKRECQILSGIKHRNLVRMVGSTWNSQFKALILEFVGNGSLEQHLYPTGVGKGDCELTLRERMSIAIDIAHGLEYLHEGCSVQVVHCDLKPQNVLLDMDRVARVADFGLGKLILANQPKEHVTTTCFLRGSIGYIPPEYGQGIEVSAKGDVYSYGILLLEMIAQKRPTSEMFSGGLNLRTWVNSALPNKVLDVVCEPLKQESSVEWSRGALHRLEHCCIHLLDAGLMCTEENPQKRPAISSIVQRLEKVWVELGFETLGTSKREGNRGK